GGTGMDTAMAMDMPAGAMPRGMATPPSVGTQIDRSGRPAISTATVSTFTPDETRDARRAAYTNSADPSTWVSDFQDEIAGTLAILDSVDTVCGNQLLAGDMPVAGRYDGLAGVLADDRLWVNAASGTNDGNLYLGVEAQALGVLPDGGAGGRRPTDDIIERSYSVLVAGALGGIDDGLPTDDATHDNGAFPFLAAPSN
ncbi:MAG: hypothetical protein AAF447_12785, partial [Myxococcota bacterium]